MKRRDFKSPKHFLHVAAAVALVAGAPGLAGCTTSETISQGYVIDQQSLDLVPAGSSREQVLLTLGTPSTTATFDNEVFYYISQTRKRAMRFLKPRVVDQHVLAVYFDGEGTVERLANYTLKDGHVFDMISRTTPTGGKDQTFLGQILSGNAALPQIAQQKAPGQI